MDKKKPGTNYKAKYREVTIKTSDGAIIQGKINLSLNQRVSDIFTKSDAPFIVMVDAFSKEGEGKIMFINKRHIIWAEPTDNQD
ncbi:DUF6812 domain-containing protein [Desulfobacterium sp. N47]|uniref:Uncharacterized protein n=1 Tax=uncultured Desulfobacterium sp. TaxID=201089 RepID=E1YBT4_9BACT|nr:hypothetical protein N47_G33520 [uncultured Desulfobacterium sp.]